MPRDLYYFIKNLAMKFRLVMPRFHLVLTCGLLAIALPIYFPGRALSQTVRVIVPSIEELATSEEIAAQI